jgi:hypothetical protein
MEQPDYGSVVLAHGYTGTAYQRFYSDGLWHGTNGQERTWEQVLNCSPYTDIIILYQPEESE